MNSKGLDYTILTIAIIGAINWGLVGFFRMDLVAFLFGNMTLLSRIIYAAVGICGLYMISMFGRVKDIAELLFILFSSYTLSYKRTQWAFILYKNSMNALNFDC